MLWWKLYRLTTRLRDPATAVQAAVDLMSLREPGKARLAQLLQSDTPLCNSATAPRCAVDLATSGAYCKQDILSMIFAACRPEVRVNIAESLGSVDAHHSVPVLIQLLSDADGRVRNAVGRSLVRLGPQAYELLIQRLGSGAGSRADSQSIRDMLVVIGPAIVDPLVKAPHWSSADDDRLAVLTELGDAAIDALLVILDAPQVRYSEEERRHARFRSRFEGALFHRGRAAMMLGKLRAVRAVPSLVRVISDCRFQYLRDEAGKALREMPDEQATRYVGRLDSIRSAAEAAIANPHAPGSIDALTSAMSDHPDKKLRSRAAKALGQIASPHSIPFLVRTTRTEDEYASVRIEAASSLAAINDTSIEELFSDILLNERHSYRVACIAAELLDRAGSERTIGKLEAFWNRGDSFNYYSIYDNDWDPQGPERAGSSCTFRWTDSGLYKHVRSALLRIGKEVGRADLIIPLLTTPSCRQAADALRTMVSTEQIEPLLAVATGRGCAAVYKEHAVGLIAVAIQAGASRLDTAMLQRLTSLEDVIGGDGEDSTSGHFTGTRKIDCSDVRRKAGQELERRAQVY